MFTSLCRKLLSGSASPKTPFRKTTRLSACRLAVERLEDRTVPSTVTDALPTDWARLDGGVKNNYTGLVWVDEVTETGGFFTWDFAQGYAANSTRNGFEDWRLPTKTEALAAADNGVSQAGFLYSPNEVPGYAYWTSTTGGNKAWTVYLTDPNHSGNLTNKASGLSLPMVRDSATIFDDGNVGYADNGWTSRKDSAAYSGDYRSAAAGNGSKTADWTFTGLEVGATYRVAVTWKASTSNASNAPFTVFDGNAPMQTVAVNQRVSAASFSIADRGWAGLGTFQITSGTLKVQLSNLANGTVVADAVRVFKVGAAPQIGTFTASATQVTAGDSVTLVASDITLGTPGNVITQVKFYLDSGHGHLDSDITVLIGTGTYSNGAWTLTFSTSGWRRGQKTLFVQALDNYGFLSDPIALNLTVL